MLKNAKDYKVNLEMIIDILRSNQLLDVYSCEVEFLKFISKSFYFALLEFPFVIITTPFPSIIPSKGDSVIKLIYPSKSFI